MHLGRGPRPTHHQQLSWHADNDTVCDVSLRGTAPPSSEVTIEIPFSESRIVYLSLKVHTLLALKSHSGARALFVARSGCCKKRAELYLLRLLHALASFIPCCVRLELSSGPAVRAVIYDVCARERQRGWLASSHIASKSKLFQAMAENWH